MNQELVTIIKKLARYIHEEHVSVARPVYYPACGKYDEIYGVELSREGGHFIVVQISKEDDLIKMYSGHHDELECECSEIPEMADVMEEVMDEYVDQYGGDNRLSGGTVQYLSLFEEAAPFGEPATTLSNWGHLDLVITLLTREGHLPSDITVYGMGEDESDMLYIDGNPIGDNLNDQMTYVWKMVERYKKEGCLHE